MENGTAPKRDVMTSFAAIARKILAERDFRWERRIRIIMMLPTNPITPERGGGLEVMGYRRPLSSFSILYRGAVKQI